MDTVFRSLRWSDTILWITVERTGKGTLKAAVLHGPHDLRIEDVPDLPRELGPKQLSVRTVVTGVSAGTETAAYSGRYGDSFYGWPVPPPTQLGYLNVGRVIATGGEVEGVRPGDLVYTRNRHCQEYLLTLDAPAEGHWPDDLFWKVPEGLRPEIAVFTYLIALGLHGVRRGELVPGETVAVVGLGPIGLGAVAIAKTLGSPVVGIDPVPQRRALALELGADAALDPTAETFDPSIADFGGEVGIDLVVEAASTWSAIKTASEIVREEGRISIIALHPGPPEYNPLGELFYRKQISLISTSYTPKKDYPAHRVRFTLRRNCQFVLDGLAAGTIRYAPAVTHHFPFGELPAVFERLAQGDRSMAAIVIHWE